jgi:hypothetical protein
VIPGPALKVFLVSGYHTAIAWAGIRGVEPTRHPLVAMPGAFWKWRLSGGFVSLAEQVEALAAGVGRPDVILATSMVDVAGLRGLVRWAGEVPVAVYMHENQITYPATGRTRVEQGHGLATWTSLLAADAVAFNSEFHRSTLLAALPRFLNSFPDESQAHHLGAVEAKSVVLPVGCDLAHLGSGPKVAPPLVRNTAGTTTSIPRRSSTSWRASPPPALSSASPWPGSASSTNGLAATTPLPRWVIASCSMGTSPVMSTRRFSPRRRSS